MSYERRIYQHIIPALGGIQLDKLTTGDIQKFYTNLKKVADCCGQNSTAKVCPTRPFGASIPPCMRH